ncbi:MAG: hypothetical protein D6738_05050 [Acidobacteria bacterium]|nr:MAG: hypothetical protein D6738_05050 [Acidobacteriota bacterium]
MSRLPRRLVAPCSLVLAVALAGCSAGEPRRESTALVPFTRHWARPIYLEDRPARAERDRPLRLAAARGEFEPASLGLFAPAADVAVRVAPGPLVGPDGATIPAGAVSVRITRYVEPYKRWRRPAGHPLLPGWLDAGDTLTVAAGTSRQVWLTLRVPQDAAAGDYRGSVRLLDASSGAALAEMPLELTVHPFALPAARPTMFLYGDTRVLDRAQLRDSREHGMNTVGVPLGLLAAEVPRFERGRFVFPGGFAPVADLVATARAEGLAVDRPAVMLMYFHLTRATVRGLLAAGVRDEAVEPRRELDYDRGYEAFFPRGRPWYNVPRHWPWRERDTRTAWPYYPVADPAGTPGTPFGRLVERGWIAAFEALETLAGQRGWPAPWYYLIDEPHHSRGAMRLALTMLRAADAAGAASFVTCTEQAVSEPDPDRLWFPPLGPEPALRLEPWLDVRAYSARSLGPETRERTRAAGDLYATYVNIYGNEPGAVRVQSGLLAVGLDLDAIMFWAWQHGSVPGPGGRSFLRDWEAVREGIDDQRYVLALEEAIASGEGPPAAQAAARELFAGIRKLAPRRAGAFGHVDPESGRWVDGPDELSSERLDALRREIAVAVAALRRAAEPR